MVINIEGLRHFQVGVIGATSLVGECLLPQLVKSGWKVVAYSRRESLRRVEGVTWRSLPENDVPLLQEKKGGIPYWIFVAPIWVASEYFSMLEELGARRVVMLSSTSRFTKDHSSDPEEQALALRLTKAETSVREWAESRGVEWVILRPTLIYGLGRDKNIAEVARIIRRLGFFPLFGQANGLRQPVHAMDVANACAIASESTVVNRAYNLSGGESLPYREMVTRIFTAMGRRSRFLPVPLWAFRGGVLLLRFVPRYRHWSAAMAERMNHDLVFDHSEATRDLAFKPKAFELSELDVIR